MLIRLWKRITGDWWTVRKCGKPFPPGYATFNRKRKTILDTGLSRERAEEICAELNAATGR